MRKRMTLLCIAVAVVLLSTGGRLMDEGMWLLDSVQKLPLADLKSHGLELTPEQIYSATGPSLKDAIVLLGGGTASFVSPEGLMVTNHHVAFAGIQAASSVTDDYLNNGFWAKSRDQELRTSYTAQIVVGMKDVTAEVLSAVSDSLTAERRSAAIRARSHELEEKEQAATGHTCRVSEIYNGVRYYLFTYQTLTDIRLVYAPPSSIGNYGGEVDNWEWPRHTGDFSLMRAYVGPNGKPARYAKDNVPFRPKVFLPISTQGYSQGSFAMIMGFPGRTFRYREAAAVQLARDETLPATIDLYKTRMDIIDRAGRTDRAIQIKYASKVRGIANTYKNYLGTLEGMRRANLLAAKQKEEAAFSAWVNTSADLQKSYGMLLDDLKKLDDAQRTVNRKYLLLMNLSSGVDLLRLAGRVRTYAHSADTARTQVLETLASTFKNLDLNTDREILSALLLKASALPPGQQVGAIQDICGSGTEKEVAERVQEFVDDLYDNSDLTTPQRCTELLAKEKDRILRDAYVEFSEKIEAEQAPVNAEMLRLTASLGQLRGKLIEAWLRWKQGDRVYPDANRTLRLTYGQVLPYNPHDAVAYNYQTTLTGVMEKETGKDPFIVPAKLRELWARKDFGRYADPRLGDVPVAFIADLDITGGNSGSPVINGKGELIGCAFDGNWEAIVGDYVFQEPLNRAISVDARYILFVLDKFAGAENIMKELVIH